MNAISLFSTFFITVSSFYVLRPIARRVGLMDHPGGRKTHEKPTPLIGGLGIFFGLHLIGFFAPEVYNHYAPLLATASLVMLIGIVDDYKHLPVSVRMGVQGLAAGLMYFAADNQLTSFGNLFGTGEIQLGILSFPITVVATVGVINAVNMSDGIDGLSAGMVSVALGFLSIMAWQAGNMTLFTFSTVVLSALLGFLALNFRLPWKKPAMIYLGDSGSTFLGFVLAWLLIEGTQGSNAVMPPALALWFLAIPLIDTVSLFVKRPLDGQSPFNPARDHLHHKLEDIGFSKKRVVLSLYVVGIVLGITGYVSYTEVSRENMLFFGFLGLFLAYCVIFKFVLVKEKLASQPQ